MPSPYSRYAHGPLVRTQLTAASLAVMFVAFSARSGDVLVSDRRVVFPVLAAAAIAALQAAPNTYTVHSGSYPLRDWRDWPDRFFETTFRFDKSDLPALIAALRLPATIRTGGYSFTADQAMTVLLLRFAGLNGHHTHVQTGLRPSASSTLNSWTLDYLYDTWYVPLLASDLKRWTPEFPVWADAVFAKTGRKGFHNVVGFIDGTLRGIARPAEAQDIWFNGHHWTHGVLWQAFTAPCGLIIDLAGPMPGRAHDCRILNKSRLLPRFVAACAAAGYAIGTFLIYADAGYHNSAVLQAPFRRIAGAYASAAHRSLNRLMSRVRIVVEWGFGRVTALWPFFRFSGGQKLGRQPIGQMYVVAVLLTNAHCCLHGNQTCQYFGLEPPTLEDYFGQAPPQPAGRAQAWDPNLPC